MKGSALAAAALAFATAASAQLSETEQRIVAAVKERSPAALQLLEKTVRINSGTLNSEGVRAVGEIFRQEFESLGFSTRWVEMPATMKRAGHLVATHEGGAARRVLLLGHIDTVFEKSSSVPLWELRGDRVRGQGVNDMKGGDVVMVEAVRALQAAGALQGMNIDVMLTGDEELKGRPIETSRGDMAALGKRAAWALSFESIGLRGGVNVVSVERRAIGGWTLRVQGKPGHASNVFGANGFGAVYEAARIVDSFRQQLVEPNLTFNPGSFAGGTNVSYDDGTSTATAFGKTNVIARHAEVRGDLRYLTAEQGERARSRMRDIATRGNLPGTSATIAFTESYPPMPPSEGGRRLLALYSRASEDAGLGRVEAADPATQGAGDVQIVAPYTVAIDGLGSSGRGEHTDDEEMELASVERGAIRAALLIYRLTRP